MKTANKLFPCEVRGTSAEIPYRCCNTDLGIVLLIGYKFASTNRKHFPYQCRVVSKEFLRVFLRHHLVGITRAGVMKYWLFSLAKNILNSNLDFARLATTEKR